MCKPNASEKEPEKRGKCPGHGLPGFIVCQISNTSRQLKIFIYIQSLGNLEVIGVQKTACFAHMTSRSYNPEFNNPLEKVVDTFQRYNTVAVSMHKTGHFTPNILVYSRIPAAYSTLLFTGCVWHLSGENVGVTISHSKKDPYPCPHRQRKFPPSREGERQNVLRCLGDVEANLCKG